MMQLDWSDVDMKKSTLAATKVDKLEKYFTSGIYHRGIYMSNVLRAEDITKVAIKYDFIALGTIVAISTNLFEHKTYCLVENVTPNEISFYKYIDGNRWHVSFSAEEIFEYDLKIEVI